MTERRWLRLQCTDDQYFADPCETPSLSNSMAKVLLDQSPMHAWTSHPRLGGKRRDTSTKTLDRGSLMHKLILGAGKRMVIVDAKDWRTNAAKEQRDAARLAGSIPVLKDDYDEAVIAAEEIGKRITDFGITLSGESEVAFAWEESVGGLSDDKIWARGMMDHLILEPEFNLATIIDIKMIQSANPKKCVRQVLDYGYDVQQAAYRSGLSTIYPEFEGRIDFRFLFCEADAPYAVTPARLDGMLSHHGERRWFNAIKLWHKCMKNNAWPGYQDVTLESPPWMDMGEDA